MVNQAIVLGRVGKIETKTASTGIKITAMSVVTSKKYMKEGAKQEKSTWHNISLFNKLAEIADKYISVGDMVYVQGEMDSNKYTDKNGIEKKNFFIIGHEIKLMPKNKPHENPQKSTSPEPSFQDDDIPW